MTCNVIIHNISTAIVIYLCDLDNETNIMRWLHFGEEGCNILSNKGSVIWCIYGIAALQKKRVYDVMVH